MEKLKIIIVNKYNDYLIMDNKINKVEIKHFNLFNDIFKFVKNYAEKYNFNFDFNLLIQSEEYIMKDLKLICDKILEDIFDYSFSEDEDEEEEVKNNEHNNNEEIENDNPGKGNKEKLEEENENEDNKVKNENEIEIDKAFYVKEEYHKKKKLGTNYVEEVYKIKN